MNILVTGANGQLGKVLKEEAEKYKINNPDDVWFFCGREDLDITDYKQVERYFIDNAVDIVINCAAYTNVEKAEDERDNAYLINKVGAGNLAKACKLVKALLIHVSTDFVFNGYKNAPYKPKDNTCPLSIYGFSKADGEQEIITTFCDYIIVRTSWLYSEYGNNFVTKMLQFIKEGKERKIVQDQIGTPTYARDLANCILSLIKYRTTNIQEILHYSNEGSCSWFEFAKVIEEIYNTINENNSNIFLPCYSDEFPTKAHRPNYSVLNKRETEEKYEIEVPYWKDSLKKCIKNIEQKEREDS